ncbi:hypothetical protein BH11BAC7_BH11BAC7_21220 [soil metagenome]
MLTTKNYFEQVDKLHILSRYPDSKEYHDFFADATDNGTNWENFEDEPETRKVIESYVAKLNKRLGESGTANAEKVQQASQERTKTYAKQNTATKAKTGRGRKSGSKNKPKKTDSKQVVKRGKKKGSGNKPGGKQKAKKILNLPKGKLVELVDPHLLFIGRYLRMNNETKTRKSLEAFFAQINKAADAKLLRKASVHAGNIIYIQQQLLKRLETNFPEYVIFIPPNKVDHMQRAIAKEQQMASVRLLKRYHNMAGVVTKFEKAKKLHNEMYNAIESGKIPVNDRLFRRTTKVMRNLALYVELEDESAILDRLPAELSGILGFMDGCLCQKDRELNGVDSPDEVEYLIQ